MQQCSVTCVRVWLGVLLAFVVISAPFAAPAPSLPDGWNARDIGIVGLRGLALGRGGAFILRGAGTSIGDRADSFQFAYLALSGDGEIVARVTELETNEAEATAGVMLRESLAPNARFAYMLVSAARGVAFVRRGAVAPQSTATTPAVTTQAAASSTIAKKRTASAVSSPVPSRRAPAAAVIGSASAREPETRSPSSDLAATTPGGDEGAPCYVRLTRRGTLVTAFKSQDGKTWTLVGSDTIPMTSTIYAGLVANNHSLRSLATVTFTAVRITRGTPASAQDAAPTTAASASIVTPAPVPSAPAPSTPPATPAPAPATPPAATPPPASTPEVTPASTPDPPATPSPSPNEVPDPGNAIAILHWNIHHGIGTDGVRDPDRIARWVAYIAPNVVSFNEVDNTELAAELHERIEARTGQTWVAWYSGADTLLLTRLSVRATSVCSVNPGANRYAAQVSVAAGGRTVNLWSTHLSVNSSDERLAELRALQACTRQWPEARVMAGDFNMQASSAEYSAATETFIDAWAAARASGLTINYDGNCDGCTRNSRIDYIFSSQGASWLTLRNAQVFDARDANGIMPSDHKPLRVIYDVH